MKLILDYKPDINEYVVTIDSKSKYKNSIIGVGKSIEESIDNLVSTIQIFLRCYKVNDNLYKTVDKWFDELKFAARVKIKLTKRLFTTMHSEIRLRMKHELVYKIHGDIL